MAFTLRLCCKTGGGRAVQASNWGGRSRPCQIGLFSPIEMRNDMRRLSFPLVDGEGLPVGCLSHEGIMSLPTWSINQRSVINFLDDIIVPLFTTSKI